LSHVVTEPAIDKPQFQNDVDQGSKNFLSPLKKLHPTKSHSALFALSKPTFFDHVDREIVDPFRSMDNFKDFLARIVDHLDFRVGVFGEYNDNIFLTPSDKTSDHILSLFQVLHIKYPMDTFYWEAMYGVNLNIYGQGDETTDTQNAYMRLSYLPFDELSFGVSDNFVKVGDSEIATSIGDQTVSAGFLTNNFRTDVEAEIWTNGFFEIFWNYEAIDFDENDFFIDRDVHTIDTRLKHQWHPLLSNHLGYRFTDVEFDETDLKDSNSHTLFYGLEAICPGILTLLGEVGFESKRFENTGGGIRVTTDTFSTGSLTIDPIDITVPFEERRKNDDNVVFSLGIESNLSKFNSVKLSYNHRTFVSSRSEFTQFLAKSFAVNATTYIDSKTILLTDLFLEFQSFDAKDSFDILFPDGDASTKIYSTGVTLRRLLTEQIFFDVGYSYTRRTTDFPGEGSNNSRFRFGGTVLF